MLIGLLIGLVVGGALGLVAGVLAAGANRAEAAQRRATARRDAFRAAGVDEIELALDGDYVRPLLAYFRQRATNRR